MTIYSMKDPSPVGDKIMNDRKSIPAALLTNTIQSILDGFSAHLKIHPVEYKTDFPAKSPL
jgi:hypothetical protein